MEAECLELSWSTAVVYRASGEVFKSAFKIKEKIISTESVFHIKGEKGHVETVQMYRMQCKRNGHESWTQTNKHSLPRVNQMFGDFQPVPGLSKGISLHPFVFLKM